MDTGELDALLSSARRPEKVVSLCLRGDLQAEWERLNGELEELNASPGRKMVSGGRETELARRIREIEGEMAGSTLELTLRALPQREWLRLVREHPGREDDAKDRAMGVNRDTFFDAMIAACVVSPELSDDQLETLLGGLTGGQYDKLWEAAWVLNRGDVDIPFSPIASRITSNSGGA